MSDHEIHDVGLQPPQKKLCVLKAADALWASLIVGPLSIVYWSGTWKIMDRYIFPNNDPNTLSVVSNWISLAVGLAVGFAGYLLIPILDDIIPARCTAKHVIISRLIIYINNLGRLNYWRGIWNLMDTYVGKDWCWSSICLAVSLVLLLIFQASASCMAVPFVVDVDSRPNFYKTHPWLRTQPVNFWRYVLDSLFSHVVISHLTIQVWRGAWNILDHFLYPDNLLKSYEICLCVGYGAAVVLFALQLPLHRLAQSLHQRHRFLGLAFTDLANIAVIVNAVFLWRGGWGLFRDFVLTELWHSWACHAGGTVFMMALFVASSVSTVGVSRDAEHGRATGVVFPNEYFTHFHRQRQLQQREDHLVRREPKRSWEHRGLLATESESEEADARCRTGIN